MFRRASVVGRAEARRRQSRACRLPHEPPPPAPLPVNRRRDVGRVRFLLEGTTGFVALSADEEERAFVEYFAAQTVSLRDGGYPPKPPVPPSPAEEPRDGRDNDVPMLPADIEKNPTGNERRVAAIVSRREMHDKGLATVLVRQFLRVHPRWVPYTKAEDRLVLGCLLALLKQGWHVREYAWAAAVKIYGSVGLVDGAEQAFRMMVRDGGVKPTSISLMALMGAYASKGKAEKMEAIWRYTAANSLDLSWQAYYHLGLFFALTNQRTQAWDTVRYVIAKGITLNPKLFAPTFRVAQSVSDLRRSVALMQAVDLPQFSSRHVSYAFEGLACACLASDTRTPEDLTVQIAEAVALFKTVMDADKRHVLHQAGTWVLGLCAVAGDVHYFESLLDACKKVVTDLPSKSFIRLLRTCVNAGSVLNTVKTFKLIPDPKASVFADVLGLYVKRKDFEGVTTVWGDMQARGVQPSVLCYSLYLQACGDRAGSTDDRFVRLSEDLFARAIDRFRTDLFLWAMQMRMYAKVSDARKARKLERLRNVVGAPKGKLYSSYFRMVSPGPTPAGRQRWEPLDASDDRPPEDCVPFEEDAPVVDMDVAARRRVVALEKAEATGIFEGDGGAPPEAASRRERIRRLAWEVAP